MTCFHPLQGYEDYVNGGIVFKESANAYKPMTVACGQCKGCRIDKSKEWAARCVHESQMHQENSFVTLTYDQEHLPHDGSLNKEHFQKFMKRLRRANEKKTIRYFHCGEYGERLERPHYHACLFGIDFDDRIPFRCDNDVITYTSETLTKIWGMGFTTCGELNYQTAAYTARYIMKKITGDKADSHYQRFDPITGEIYKLQPEYTTMSLGRKKGDGLGARFFKKYETDFFPSDECPIPGKGVDQAVPRYYETLYAEKNPDQYAAIKQRRQEYHQKQKHDFTPERLQQREKVKDAQLKQLKRNI